MNHCTPSTGDDAPGAITSRSSWEQVRGLRYHLRHWGDAHAPSIVLLHGWLDCAAMFEPLARRLQQRWHVVAPDWRGCGDTDWPADARFTGYRFLDYLADLDAILARLSPDAPVCLVGHSLGANVVAQYAGLRPQRVRRLVCLDAAEGTDAAEPADIGERIARWIDVAAAFAACPHAFTSQPDFATLKAVLAAREPNWRDEVVALVARHNHACGPDGRWRPRADPAHAIREPLRYRPAEIDAIWARVTAPVLALDAAGPTPFVRDAAAFLARRQRSFRRFDRQLIEPAGHHLHLDHPERIAAAVDAFLLAPDAQ